MVRVLRKCPTAGFAQSQRCIERQIVPGEPIRARELSKLIHQELGLDVHPRTIERAVGPKKLRGEFKCVAVLLDTYIAYHNSVRPCAKPLSAKRYQPRLAAG